MSEALGARPGPPRGRRALAASVLSLSGGLVKERETWGGAGRRQLHREGAESYKRQLCPSLLPPFPYCFSLCSTRPNPHPELPKPIANPSQRASTNAATASSNIQQPLHPTHAPTRATQHPTNPTFAPLTSSSLSAPEPRGAYRSSPPPSAPKPLRGPGTTLDPGSLAARTTNPPESYARETRITA